MKMLVIPVKRKLFFTERLNQSFKLELDNNNLQETSSDSSGSSRGGALLLLNKTTRSIFKCQLAALSVNTEQERAAAGGGSGTTQTEDEVHWRQNYRNKISYLLERTSAEECREPAATDCVSRTIEYVLRCGRRRGGASLPLNMSAVALSVNTEQDRAVEEGRGRKRCLFSQQEESASHVQVLLIRQRTEVQTESRWI
ncbi:hypothetical protein INR49_007117 [Caranx melampygus]|nr:hypothetical protein INR49_007117 [Caranx melampygus]